MNAHTHSVRTNRLNNSIITLLFLVTLSIVIPSAARADNLVQNGGFETGDFTGWTVTGDVQGAQVVTGGSNSGCCYAKFNPIDGYAYISQYISTPHTPNNAAANYSLIFDWHIIDLPPWDFQVFWNGQLVNDVQNTGPQQWTQVELDGLSATQGETLLTFGFKVSDGQSYFGLDDISVSQQTPEPGTLILLGSGVLGLAGIARRRFFGDGTN